MHVLLDARNITARPTGVGRYAQALIPRLIRLEPGWEWTVLRHDSNKEPMFDAREVFVPQPNDDLAHYLRGERVFHRAVKNSFPEVFHSLFHIVPRKFSTAKPTGLRLVTTVHDFIWIDHPGISQSTALGAVTMSAFARRAIPTSLRASDAVIAVSEATAARARAYIDDPIVITHGVEPRYFEPLPEDDAIIAKLRGDGWRYVVAVGNDKYYKNLQTLVRAFAQLSPEETRLVLVGSCDGLRPLAEELGVAEDIVFAGALSDVDLRRVVGNASAFVFPSLVEGFGLPPLEAMALGVPTLVSDLEPMRGVAGDAALRFEPTDVGALTVALEQVLTDERLAVSLSDLGRAHARTFDWDATAERTLATYTA